MLLKRMDQVFLLKTKKRSRLKLKEWLMKRLRPREKLKKLLIMARKRKKSNQNQRRHLRDQKVNLMILRMKNFNLLPILLMLLHQREMEEVAVVEVVEVVAEEAADKLKLTILMISHLCDEEARKS